ncbi:MAG: alpha/beta hydrolase [Anaerolineae bacterium]|nr:alpha/beta hydrolase [Anaerolineae bacterium]
MPTTTIAEHTVFYLDHQSENASYPPLVLVHGAGGSRHDWPQGLQELPNTRVLTVDLPGHADSPGLGCPSTLAYAEVICGLLDDHSIDAAIIAGHSMGGAIAQEIAINMPDRAAGIILVGTGSKLAVDPTLPQRIVDDPPTAVDWLTDWSWGTDVTDAMKNEGRQRLLSVAPTVLQGDYRACMGFDARPYLEQISVPTLVLGSDADHMVPLKFSVTLAERIPNAQLVTLQGAGHNFPLERPAAVINAIATWLAATWSS